MENLHNNPNDKPYGKTYKKPITVCVKEATSQNNKIDKKFQYYKPYLPTVFIC
jgi:hypothetical protein